VNEQAEIIGAAEKLLDFEASGAFFLTHALNYRSC
jgi:hypothetical protein